MKPSLALFTVVIFAISVSGNSCTVQSMPKKASTPLYSLSADRPFLVSSIYSDETMLGKKLIIKDIVIDYKKMPGNFDYEGLHSQLMDFLTSKAANPDAPDKNPNAILEAHKTYSLIAGLFDRSKNGSSEEIILLCFVEDSIIGGDTTKAANFISLTGKEQADKWFVEFNVKDHAFQNFHY